MTNSRRPGSSGHRSSTRKELPSQNKEFSNENVKKYVDDNGFSVIEYKTPTTHLILRYNDTQMIYIMNSEIRYSGPIRNDILDKKLEELDIKLSKLNTSFDGTFYDFDKMLDDFDKDLDVWDHYFDKLIEDFPTFSSGSSVSISQNSSSGTGTYKRSVRTKRSSGSSGCLGCFLWTILIFVIFCLVLYGMGALGRTIFDFLAGIFN